MSDGGDEPVGTFAIHFAEGDMLFKQCQYAKAIDSYTKALDLQPNEVNCLVARSKSYLQLGEIKQALDDAEDSLKENGLYHKGLYQKAEVLYAKGDFEHALVFYHRGHRIRPELREFLLGIQKAQEAVNNSIGTPDACKLEKIGDLSFFQQQDNIGKKKKKLTKPMLASQQKKERKHVASDKTIKELLGEMYPDREYLEKLMAEPNLVIGRRDRTIYKTVEEALIYLDARTEFWRQQKPMYARKREKELNRYKPSPTRPVIMGNLTAPKDTTTVQTKQVLKQLEEIDAALASGEAEVSLIKAEKLLRKVEKMPQQDIPNKTEFIASLYSCIGNAQLELGEAESALDYHLKDLRIAEQMKNNEMIARALDNVGRVYAVMGKFRKASEYWRRKIPLVTSSEESAWLHHELGRCQLELGEFAEALELGNKSLEAAELSQDQMWRLNASMLIAQAQSRMDDFDSAVDNFERALEIAKELEDDATREAIAKAMEDVRLRLTGGEAGKEESTSEVLKEVEASSSESEKTLSKKSSSERESAKTQSEIGKEDSLSPSGKEQSNPSLSGKGASTKTQSEGTLSEKTQEQSEKTQSEEAASSEKRGSITQTEKSESEKITSDDEKPSSSKESPAESEREESEVPQSENAPSEQPTSAKSPSEKGGTEKQDSNDSFFGSGKPGTFSDKEETASEKAASEKATDHSDKGSTTGGESDKGSVKGSEKSHSDSEHSEKAPSVKSDQGKESSVASEKEDA